MTFDNAVPENGVVNVDLSVLNDAEVTTASFFKITNSFYSAVTDTIIECTDVTFEQNLLSCTVA